MTIQEKAREWAEKEYPTQPITTTIDSLAYNQRNLQNRNVAVNAYLAGAVGAMEWVPVSELPKDRKIICVAAISGEYWTATAVATNGQLPQFGMLLKSTHFMELPPLPPHPEK